MRIGLIWILNNKDIIIIILNDAISCAQQQ